MRVFVSVFHSDVFHEHQFARSVACVVAPQRRAPAETVAPVYSDKVTRHVDDTAAVSYKHLRAHETVLDLVCRLLLEKKNLRIKLLLSHVGA